MKVLSVSSHAMKYCDQLYFLFHLKKQKRGGGGGGEGGGGGGVGG